MSQPPPPIAATTVEPDVETPKKNGVAVADTPQPSRTTEHNNNDATEEPMGETIKELMVSLKTRFQDRIHDKVLVKTCSQLNVYSTKLCELTEKTVRSRLELLLQEEVQGLQKKLQDAKKSEMADQKILESSAIAVQKINQIQRSERKKADVNKQLSLLRARNELIDKALTLTTEKQEIMAEVAGQFSATFKDSYSHLMK